MSDAPDLLKAIVAATERASGDHARPRQRADAGAGHRRRGASRAGSGGGSPRPVAM